MAFPSQVKTCAAIATVGDPGNGIALAPNGVYTGEGPNAQTIYIETKNPGGGLSSGVPFHLVLLCPGTPGVLAALVRANGVTLTGSSSLASYKTGTGRFLLVTRTTVSACASVATRGSLDTSVPFNPATVEWVPGPASNTVAVQTRTLLFFGGTFSSQSFHAAIVC